MPQQSKWDEFKAAPGSSKWDEYKETPAPTNVRIQTKAPKPKASISSISRPSAAAKTINFLSQQADNPIASFLRKATSDVAEFISPREIKGPVPESTFTSPLRHLREGLAGATEAAGETGALLTSPQNIALTATGAQALKTGSQGYKTASRLLSTPIAAEGIVNTLGPGRTPSERGLGVAQTAGGLTGMVFPRPRAKAVLAPEQKALPPGRGFNVTPEGIVSDAISFKNEPLSRRDALAAAASRRGERLLPDIETRAIKSEEVPLTPKAKIEEIPLTPKAKGEEAPAQDFIKKWEDYITGPKNIADEYTLPSEREPSFAREGNLTKIGADPQALGKILASGYKANMPQVIMKELLQNSVDATRHLGDAGEITVRTGKPSYDWEAFTRIKKQIDAGEKLDDYDQKRWNALQKKKDLVGHPTYIEVADNGMGMTREQLDTVFTDLGASGKRTDESAVGGFGIAKAAPLLGGELVEVKSVVLEADGKLYEHSFEGSPEELFSGVEIKTVPAKPGTPTGTSVKTYLPEDSSLYDAKNFMKNMVKTSTGFKGKLNYIESQGDFAYSPESFMSPRDMGKPIKLSHEVGDTEIIIPPTAEYGDRAGVDVKILNNGMFQGESHYGGYNTLPNVPDEVIVNIKSKVAEGHRDYPFTMTREGLKGPIHDLLGKYIDENIVKPGRAAKSRYIKELYNNIDVVKSGDKAVHYYDAGKKFTPEEFSTVQASPVMHALGSTIDDVIREAIDLIDPSLQGRLEKTGFLFDQDNNSATYGIWIPNPGTDNAAILINPLAAISGLDWKIRNPYEAASHIHHTIMHEINHFKVGPHNEEFTSNLSKVYEKYGSKGFFTELTAKQRIYRQLTGGGEGYLPEIQELLPIYKESRRRSRSYEDPLYRTGIKSADSESGGADKVSRRSRPNPERVAAASSKLIEALRAAKPLREQQEAIYSAERSDRFSRFMTSLNKGSGRAGFFRAMKNLQGEMEKVISAPVRLDPREADVLFSAIGSVPGLTPGERIRTGIALAKLLDGGPVPQRGELSLLDKAFGGGFGQGIIEMHGGLGLVKMSLNKAFNTMKSLMASIDMSAPFMQGIGLVHRKEFRSAFLDMFKYFGDHQAFEALQKSLEERRYFTEGKEAGLYLAGETLDTREEQFLTSYLHDLRYSGKAGKIITEPYAASERAYVGFLNKLRADTFDNMYEKALTFYQPAINAAKTPQEGAEAIRELQRAAGFIAKFVNTRTGRGNLGRWSKYGEDMNMLLFSPRLIASRMQMMNILSKDYWKAPQPFRYEALKSLAAITGFIGLVNTLGYFLGGKPTIDPRNSDFGKVKVGENVRINPTGGFSSYIAAMARFISGKTVSPTSGNVRTLGEGWGTPSRISQLVGIGGNERSFLENKFSPAASLIENIILDRDYIGRPVRTPEGMRQQLIEKTTPIFMQDMYDLMMNEPDLFPLAVPAAFGVNVQRFEPRERQIVPRIPKVGVPTPRP